MTELSSRDLELLSAYLDGQLSQADGVRLESRLNTDSELRSAYDGLRQTRALLRKLPARRAPRNFRLTPQMVGAKPSVSRSFPIFRLTSVLASILLFLGYAINLFAPAGSMGAATVMPYADSYSIGAAEATQAPEVFAPAMAATETVTPLNTQESQPAEPTSTEGIMSKAAIMPTETTSAAEAQLAPQDSARTVPELQPVSRAATLPIHPFWLFGLLGLAVVSGAGAFIVHKRAAKLTSKDIVLIVLGLLIAVTLAIAIYGMLIS